MAKGKIILMEGTDGSGKNTQAKKLVERLTQDGLPCEMMSFPRYDTPTGRIIGQCYLGKNLGEGDKAWFGEADSVDPNVASLYYSADQKAAEGEIRRIINSGTHLVLDRYVESNMGHQGGKETDPEKRKKFIKFIEDLSYGVLNLPRPDLTIFLYLPYEHGEVLRKKRGGERDGHESNLDHLIRAEETYEFLSEKYEWKKITCNVLGNTRSEEDISEEVYKHVLPLIKQ